MTGADGNHPVPNGFASHELEEDGAMNPPTRVKAVNLGGWLVTEGWIKPSLFDGIPNKDLLDGTRLQFKSAANGKYLSVDNGRGGAVRADAVDASAGETFRLWRIADGIFQFRVSNKQFVGLDSDDKATLVASYELAGKSETFEVLRCPDDPMLVRIRAPNGYFLQVRTDELVAADCEDKACWVDDDPSVFSITITKKLEGEFQVTNGYGLEKAEQIMREHWSTYIIEEDFKFVSENGLNTVRIPVGWWIASDPTPPPPYVGGSLVALDNAFSWAKKHKLKVIIDLHAASGSQNGWEHSSSRDGFQEWAATDDDIRETVAVIEFLTARYSDNPSLYAVQLLNEPLSPIVSLENIAKFYKAGFEAVRRHSPTSYVIFSTVLGTGPEDLLPLASVLERSVIDVHYYNLFRTTFDTIEGNMDCVYTKRSAHLSSFTKEGGPLTFIGEWVAEWKVKGATAEELKRFAEAQLEVYGKATFGWAYWTLKNVNNHWSLEWMIKNGYIKI
ncbi:hypothetical protein MLD38_001462 [Melastoma candidum]|uniref:Uncharacterized protein n=1 Tax=Melastoma candidum TaxID=119954 RepID=A0ACB9SEY1_9MYRT|nr:hypothetical protein MLD38_001462 [Melastoma candidum]